MQIRTFLFQKVTAYTCSLFLFIVFTHNAYASDMFAYLASNLRGEQTLQNKTAVQHAVVQVYVSGNKPHYINAWMAVPPANHRGTGFVLDGDIILTNAHVISDQSAINIRKYSNSKKYPARVLYISHAADLALLTVDNPDFFQHVEPLHIGNMPHIQKEVLLYGYPEGESLIASKGLLTGIEKHTYLYSNHVLPAGKVIQASVKPGNSGGPVVMDGEVVGVVMQTSKTGDTSLIIPGQVIKNTLTAFKAIHNNNSYNAGYLPAQAENKEKPEKFSKVPLRYLSFL